jgi:Leucine-rich repeat (LRR) protein/predicted Ser/Thr protein kinase/tetratricopeptide (TPR) repeat protein
MSEIQQSNQLAAETFTIGKYRVGALLGKGGWGEVYQAQNVELGKPVAIKLLYAHFAEQPERRERFEREAKAASMLKHPGICPVFDYGVTDDGRPFFVMELLEGTTLAKLVEEKKRLKVQEALPIFSGLCDALTVAHNAGIVHRDVNPANVMLKEDDQPVLVDFGIAKVQTDEMRPSVSLTDAGTVMGTAEYMSPEQCMGKPLDARTDIYSLACVLYEALSGQPPFTGDSKLAIMHQQVEVPASPFDLRLRVPAAVEEVIMRGLQKDPTARPQTAEEFKQQLLSASKRRTWLPAILLRLPRAAAAAAAALTVLLVAGGTAGIYFTVQMIQKKPSAPPAPPTAMQSLNATNKARSLLTKAEIAYHQGAFQQSLSYVGQLVPLCEGNLIRPEEAAEMLSACEVVYSNTGMYVNAEKTALKAIARLKEFCKPNAPQLMQQQLQLAEIYAQGALRSPSFAGMSRDYAFSPFLYKAERVLDQLCDSMKAAGTAPDDMAPILAKQAQNYIIEGRYREACDVLAKVLPRMEKYGDVATCADLYCSYGNALGKLGEPALAEAAIKKSNELTNMRGDLNGTEVPSTLADLACMFEVTGRPKDAAKYFAMASKMFAKFPDSDFRKQRLQRAIAEFNLYNGDPHEALAARHRSVRYTIFTGRNSDTFRSTFDSHETLDEMLRIRVRPKTLVVNSNSAKSVTTLPTYEQLKELEGLDLTAVKIGDDYIARLGSLPNLKYLMVGDTEITDGFAVSLAQFPNLEELDVSATLAGKKTAAAILRLSKLKRLDAHGSQMRDAEMAVLARSTSLERLGLSHSGITDQGLINLSRSRNIRMLDLRDAKVTDKGIAALGAMPQLERLELLRNLMTGSGLGSLAKLKGLFFSAPITPQVDLSGIANLTKLQILRLPNTYADNSQLAFLPKLTKLKELNLACSKFDDDAVKLLKALPNLTRVNLNHTGITQNGLKQLVECGGLTDIRVAQNNLHDISALRQLPKLQFLNLADNPIDDSAVQTLTALPDLARLDIDHTNMTAKAVRTIGANRKITQLSINDYPDLTVDDLLALSHDDRLIWFDQNYLTAAQRRELQRRSGPGKSITSSSN